MQEYYNMTKILIRTSAKPSLKRNIKYIEYLIVKLYQTGDKLGPQRKQVSLVSLSLYAELSLTLLNNKYFDRFRELAELELSREGIDLQFVL